MGRLLLLLLLLATPLFAQERFPTPEFESGYEMPHEQLQAPAPGWVRILDVGLYAAALALTGWLLLRRRWRAGVALVAVLALLYFGFWRHGCICPVGSIGNVARALLLEGYAVPLTVVALFGLPLLAALVVGRVFCGGVCPLGALQDVFLLRPLQLPRWLDEPLGLVRWVYLGLVVLAVYTTGRFLVCRYDPFVGFFRNSGPSAMLIAGGGILLLGTVVGRPYCRWLCPYGALLGLASRFSWRQVHISPAECVRCGLCAEACPFGAIRMYEEGAPAAPPSRALPLWPFLLLLLLLPAAGAWAGRQVGPAWAEQSRAVSLYREVIAAHGQPIEAVSDAVKAVRSKGPEPAVLQADAMRVQERFDRGATWFGGFLGLLFALKLLTLRRRRPPETAVVEGRRCFSCGRCYRTCPIHRKEVAA